MVTKEEWDALDKKVKSWLDFRCQRELEESAKRVKDAAQKLHDDLRPDPEILRKPTTI